MSQANGQAWTPPEGRTLCRMASWSWDQANVRHKCGVMGDAQWEWFDREWRRTHGEPRVKRNGTWVVRGDQPLGRRP